MLDYSELYEEVNVTISGDIHLNLRSNDSEVILFEYDRFLKLFKEFSENDSDIIILNGDIFDKAKPSFKEIGLFYEGLELLKNKTVFVVEGNHEELSKTQTTFDYLPEVNFRRIKADVLTFNSTYLWLVGHPHIDNIKKDLLPIMYDKKNILISHYRSDIGYADAEVDNEMVSNRFDDAILSDIHYRLSPADNIQYTSSPYGIHFTPDKDYGYCTVSISKKGYNIEFKKLLLPSKAKVTTTTEDLKETLKQLEKSFLYNIEVSGKSSSEHLDELNKYSNVVKFSFSEQEGQEEFEDITDELKASSEASVIDIIITALDDGVLEEDEMERARKVLSEVL